MIRQWVLILLFPLMHLQAQQVDSLFKANKSRQTQYYDSLAKHQKQKSRATIDSGQQLSKRKLTAAMQKEQQGIKNSKAKVRSATDSSARAAYKTRGKTLLKEEVKPIGTAKTKANEQWKTVKTQFKNPFKLSIEVRSESYTTTAQNPMMRNEPLYSRLYVAPTLSVFGLPFKANFFLTTENNNTYKSNFFSFRFDANAMRQQAANDIQKELDDAKKLDRMRQYDLNKNAFETQRYEQELGQMKNKLPDIDDLEKTLQQQAEEKSREYIEAQKQATQEKMKNATEEEKAKIQKELERRSDSIINHYKQKAGDSLLKAKGRAGEKVDSTHLHTYSEKIKNDTAQLGKYLRMRQKLDQLQTDRKKLEDLRQMDSAKLLQKAGGVRNPDDLRHLAKEQLPGNKFLKTILAVDRFGIGVVNPQYSEFTLYAASVKGLDIGINQDKWFYDLTVGRTTKQVTGPFTSTKPVYDRNLAIARAGYGELKGNHLSAEYLYAFDPATENKNIPRISNGVLNVSANFTMLKNTKIEANAARSNYRESFTAREIVAASANGNASPTLGSSANNAYQLKASQKLNEDAKIEANIRQTGAGFRTVGNPFLRRNFREFEFKYDHQFFKKKVKFSGFYKEMRDNLIELNKATNRMKGYGLKLSTAFEKYPNLSLSYSPYQQGNNHPDSAYRTNNQFSVTTAIITYRKRFRALNWNGLLSYTRSAMQMNDRGTVAYRLISSVHTLQIGMRHTSIITYLSNVTAPFVDSLNSNSVQFNHTYLATKKITLGVLGEQTQYKNGAYRSGVGLQAGSTIFRNFNLTLTARYDRIHKLWHLSDANVFTGRVVMVWRW